MQPGTIVRFRQRDWVLLPSAEEDIYRLRPLAGSSDEPISVHRDLSTLIGYDLPEERIQPSQFPLPSPEAVSDAVSAHLLWQAARLSLREGATPFRSLGRISIRPRVYQFVPLLMALRLDPVRLFIADDVGVGKTIEALLIARELIDRGEVHRLAVLCPPYLCDQWGKELREKFNLEPVIIRSSTVGQLERHKPVGRSIYEHYPIQVISIDWVKSDRNRHQFLQFCPELVIVDEAHGAAEATEGNKSQQQRHRLLRKLAQDQRRHLILLTATPHSGIEKAFRSLLGLLRPEFQDWDTAHLNEKQRAELARHFVQRARRDIEQDWEGERCFPIREAEDVTYSLSEAYRALFEETYRFCSELIQTGERLEQRRRRVRYWGALALLRCVMSSPAAAAAALARRSGAPVEETSETAETTEALQYEPFVFEATRDVTDDETPTPPIRRTEAEMLERDRRRLRQLERMAQALIHSPDDTKLACCAQTIRNLLDEGFYPIVWCRYVNTAEYVGKALRHHLPQNVQVTVITGRLGDEERRDLIGEIDTQRPRVLVATDCLSEGINLQEKFTAVLHYDLPWNPNRLEQREGRVDRFGQTAPRVRVIRFYGRDNPVDGAVIEVLLNKAQQIHKALGIYVPIPEESETVMEAVLNALFLRRRPLSSQLFLFDQDETLREFHTRWDRDAERERLHRTRFAQRALRPEEVRRELEAVDDVLGDPTAVREFVLNAAQRLGLQILPDRRNGHVFHIPISPEATPTLPDAVRFELPKRQNGVWTISFVSPTPQGAEYIGRNHRFVAALAGYLFEEALLKGAEARAARCGAIRTRSVDLLTTLLLLRIRYLIQIPQQPPQLAEEVRVFGFQPPGVAEQPWLDDDEALQLLVQARPDANLSLDEKRELVQEALKELGQWHTDNGEWGRHGEVQQAVRQWIERRAKALEQSHKRIRKAVSLRIRELKVVPQFPPDVLGILVLQPVIPT